MIEPLSRPRRAMCASHSAENAALARRFEVAHAFLSPFLHGLVILVVGKKGGEMSFKGIILVACAGLFLGCAPETPVLERSDIFDQIAKDVERSQSRIVIINGAHNGDDVNDYHRMFASCLLDRLAIDGFTYFAAETFSDDIAEQVLAGYPSQTNGFYVDDLAWGDLIRTALDHDMTFIPYEIRNDDLREDDRVRETALMQRGYSTGSINRRDWQQAKNLIDRVLNKDLTAKVFVYVGYSHITEYKNPASDSVQVWLARFLQEIYGIDPFTIDQVDFLGSAQMKNSPMPMVSYWRVGNGNAELNLGAKNLYRKTARTDAGVIHNWPKTHTSEYAHDYLYMCNHRQKISVYIKYNTQPSMQNWPYLIEAYRATDDITEAIPLDRVWPSKNDEKVTFYLPMGRILIQRNYRAKSRPMQIGDSGPIPAHSETEIIVVQ